jgi:hypothetical protein
MDIDELNNDNPFERLLRSKKIRKIEQEEQEERDSDPDYIPTDLETLFEQKADEQTKRKSKRKKPSPPKKTNNNITPGIVRYVSVSDLKIGQLKIDSEAEDNNNIIVDESSEQESSSPPSISQLQILDEDDITDDEYCFGCAWADYSEMDGEDINNMLRMIDEGFMKSNNKDLAENVQQFYENVIYKQMREKGAKIKKWSSKSIQNHIEQHIKEPRYYIGRMIMMYERIMMFLESKIAVAILDPLTGTENILPNIQIIKLLMDIEKRTTELRKTDPKKMNFHNEKCTLDYQNLGKLINPNNFSTSKNKR